MKKLIAFGFVSFMIASSAFAAANKVAADPCRAAALTAAEDQYGNYPNTTHVKTVQKGREYRVAVGIGNPEDGEHDFMVVFENGCDSKPTVTEFDSQ
jgi:hypothetical protein